MLPPSGVQANVSCYLFVTQARVNHLDNVFSYFSNTVTTPRSDSDRMAGSDSEPAITGESSEEQRTARSA
ncbi:hypothetical protein ACI1US_01614 [Leucobacter sp. BZR 635]